MKKFFGEFKKFITRGNIVDMAVGVIVGSSFTAIVNALSNNILKPIINFIIAKIMGKDALSECYKMLLPAYKKDEAGEFILENNEKVIDLAESIYIDWGAFIMAIINFLIVAFVLFCMVKAINRMRENSDELEKKAKKNKLTKEDRKALKAKGIKRSDKAAVKAYFEEKAEAEAKAKAEKEAKEAADKLANPKTTEDLLKAILTEMKNK